MNILYRILAIDPGIENTGVAIIDVYQHKLPQLVYSDTIITKVLIKPLNDIVNSYGLRQTKQIVIRNKLTELLYTFTPNIVVIESSFIAKSINAFKSLNEIMILTESMVQEFNILNSPIFKPIYMYKKPPKSIKKNLGLSELSSDKSLVKNAIKEYPLNFNGYDITPMDEHAIDAIAIGLWIYNQFFPTERFYYE